MRFEKDNLFLTFRFLFFTFCTAIFFYFGNKLLSNKTGYDLGLGLLCILVMLSNLFIGFLMIHTIDFEEKTLIMKNIYGIKIKEIKVKEIKGRKVNHFKSHQIPNILFLKKYDQILSVKYHLNDGNYSVNGQILSHKGFKMLLSKTKK